VSTHPPIARHYVHIYDRLVTRHLTLLAIALTAIAVACTGNRPAAPPTATNGAATPVASAASSTAPAVPTATTNASPAATAVTTPTSAGSTTTPTVSTPPPPPTPIPTPRITPTPGIKGEPIASTSSLSRSELPLVEFSRGSTPVASLPIEVLPPDEFPVGFSGRPSLSEERGMLFWYAKMARGSFWMKDTHFDLAIAFVASDETIVDIVEMQRESTSVVTPKADYQYAIEAPAGWYLAHGVRLGDRAHLAFPLPSYLTNQ
jgi:uncharacterized membrane protein (UPF0127 family)